MSNRWGVAGLLVVAALAAGGCASGSGGGGGGGGDIVNDVVGGEPVPGKVRITNIVRAEDGGVTYTLANADGQLHDDLSWQVEFLYSASEEGAIKMRGDREFSLEEDLVMLATDTAKVVKAENPRKGRKVVAAQLHVREDPPIAAVPRTDNQVGTGTVFLGRTVECVAMSTEDDVRAGRLWIEFENLTNRPASRLQARAAFRDMASDADGRKVGETKWTTIKEIPANGRARVEFDISGLGRVAQYTFLVKMRQKGF